MARLFGTDGVRGVANVELTPELVSVDLCNVSFLRLSNTSVNNCVQRRYISFFRNLADNCYLREVRSMDTLNYFNNKTIDLLITKKLADRWENS